MKLLKMKRPSFISLLILISVSNNIRGQDKIVKSYPWSFSFSYSPKINVTKDYILIGLFSGDQSNFLSFDHKVDHRFTKHFSFSFGIDFNKIDIDNAYRSFDGTAYRDHSFYKKTILIEFPVQLNYHFRDTIKTFDPYVKMAFRNAFHYQYIEVSSSYTIMQITEKIRYFNFLDIGIGSYLRLSNYISLKYETSFGIATNYQRSKYSFVEGLIGIRYTLK